MESPYFFYQSFQDIVCLFFSLYKGIFSCQDTPCIVLQLFNLFFFFFFFFFFQPFIGLGQAFQSLLQVLFWRKGRKRYTRYTICTSCWFYYLFCRFLVFFFRRRLRMSSFFSLPSQARRRGRKRRERGEKEKGNTSVYPIGTLYIGIFLGLPGPGILQGGFLQFLQQIITSLGLLSPSPRGKKLGKKPCQFLLSFYALSPY